MQLFVSVHKLITNKNVHLFVLTLLYYVSLVFVNANLQFLIATTCFALGVFWLVKKWWLTLWYVFLIILPFPKGRTLLFTLIPKENLIARNAIFDINYILSVYLSDGVLLLLGWITLKKLFARLDLMPALMSSLRWIGRCFVAFLILLAWPQRDTPLLPIVLLSGLQVMKVAGLFLLPQFALTLYRDPKKQFAPLTQFALLAGLFFQTTLAVMQFLRGGPLGWYIEGILPLGNNGQPIAISTMENADILRVSGSFFDPSLLGTFIFSMLFWLWYHKPAIVPNWLKWMGIFAANITIILTSNRLLMLSLFFWWIYQAFLIFKNNNSNQKKLFQKTRFNWILGVGLIALIAIVPYFITRLSSLTSLFSQYGSGTYRIELARYAIRLVNEQPWGVGLNLSPYYLATQFNQEIVSFDPAPPHNIFFQLLAETGFLGVLLVVVMLYLIYRPIQKTRQLIWLKTGAGMGGLAFLYCAQFYPVFINQVETLSWLMVFLGIYWAEKQKLIDVKK